MIFSASFLASSLDSFMIAFFKSLASFKIESLSILAFFMISSLSACNNCISSLAFSADSRASLIPSSLSFIVSKIGFQANFFNKKIKDKKIKECQKNSPSENSSNNFSIINKIRITPVFLK